MRKNEINIIKTAWAEKTQDDLSSGKTQEPRFVTLLGEKAIVLQSDVDQYKDYLRREKLYREDLSFEENVKLFHRDIKRVRVVDDEEKLPEPPICCDDLLGLVKDLIGYTPFLNPEVSLPISKSIVKNLKEGVINYPELALLFQRALYVYDEKSKREWERIPAIREVKKILIFELIDMIADPAAWNQLGEEAMKKQVEKLKAAISEEFDTARG